MTGWAVVALLSVGLVQASIQEMATEPRMPSPGQGQGTALNPRMGTSLPVGVQTENVVGGIVEHSPPSPPSRVNLVRSRSMGTLDTHITLLGGGERDVTDEISAAIPELPQFKSAVAHICCNTPSTLLSQRTDQPPGSDPKMLGGCTGGVSLLLRAALHSAFSSLKLTKETSGGTEDGGGAQQDQPLMNVGVAEGEADELFLVIEGGKIVRGRVWARGIGDCELTVKIMGERVRNLEHRRLATPTGMRRSISSGGSSPSRDRNLSPTPSASMARIGSGFESPTVGAEHVVGTPRKGDARSAARRSAVSDELQKLGLDVEEILTSIEYDGTQVRKCLTSFINPRANRRRFRDKSPRLGAVSSSTGVINMEARRVAEHVMMLYRQRQAMLADWIRNSDAAREEREERASKGLGPSPLTFVLDNVRSVYNVGSIFRTAETAGAAEVITCGITPHPPHEKLTKTGFSAVERVKTRHFGSTVEAVETLEKEGVQVFAMETSDNSRGYTKVAFPQPTALILGNELTGVAPNVISMCRDVVEIPTLGKKNSLNVACAAAVVAFECLRQWDFV